MNHEITKESYWIAIVDNLSILLWQMVYGIRPEEGRKRADAIVKTLDKKGVRVDYDNGYIMYIKRSSLGIKAWGYVDAITRAMKRMGTPFKYIIVDSAYDMPEFSGSPRTRRVDSVKAKLQNKKELAAKKPYKYAVKQ